ncbi:hypothetical protein JM654_16545 [Microbacterium oxydans]|nr:hypothetical protein [Microbacterium oxydans]
MNGLGDLAGARDTADDSLSGLAVGLAAIALLVGGIGIANTMVVAVLERRGEIGLRRALGARSGQIAGQFVAEAIVLGGLGVSPEPRSARSGSSSTPRSRGRR